MDSNLLGDNSHQKEEITSSMDIIVEEVSEEDLSRGGVQAAIASYSHLPTFLIDLKAQLKNNSKYTEIMDRLIIESRKATADLENIYSELTADSEITEFDE